MPKGKQPWMKWYTGDWLRDPAVSMCSAATRGILMDLLCAMHETGSSGRIAGTVAQLARVARCSVEEMAAAVQELEATDAADVTVSEASEGVTGGVTHHAKRHAENVTRHAFVTVENRRMKRECRGKSGDAERARNYRARRQTSDARQAPLTRESRENHGQRHAEITPPIFRGQKSESEACASGAGAREGSALPGKEGRPEAGRTEAGVSEAGGSAGGSHGASFARRADPAVSRREAARSLPPELADDRMRAAIEIWVDYLTDKRGRAPVMATLDRQLVELAEIVRAEGIAAAEDAIEFAIKAGLSAPVRDRRGKGKGEKAEGRRPEGTWAITKRLEAIEEELRELLYPGGCAHSVYSQLPKAKQERAQELAETKRKLKGQLTSAA